MSARRDGLRPSEVARAKRVAQKIANTIQQLPQRGLAVRNLIIRLKEHSLRPRDLDTSNGEDALAAIIATMSQTNLNVRMSGTSLGKIWELIASRALQLLGKNTYHVNYASQPLGRRGYIVR